LIGDGKRNEHQQNTNEEQPKGLYASESKVLQGFHSSGDEVKHDGRHDEHERRTDALAKFQQVIVVAYYHQKGDEATNQSAD
jgi:hypothetical protein